MRSAEVRELRQQKLNLYRRHVAPDALDEFELNNDLTDDSAYARLLELVARLGGPTTGLQVGRQRSISQIGILRDLTLRCPTIDKVLELWLNVADFGGEVLRAQISSSGAGSITLEMGPSLYLSPSARRLYLDEMVTAFHAFIRELTGRWPSDGTVEFPHRPSDRSEYYRLFGTATKFGRSQCRVIFAPALLEMPVIHPQPYNPLVDIDGFDGVLSTGNAWREKVLIFLEEHSGEAYDLSAAARSMGISGRTLSRNLSLEGSAYSQIRAEFRLKKARRLMSQGNLRTKQIAHLLGFKSENSFRVYIRTATGMTFNRLQASVRKSGNDAWETAPGH